MDKLPNMMMTAATPIAFGTAVGRAGRDGSALALIGQLLPAVADRCFAQGCHSARTARISRPWAGIVRYQLARGDVHAWHP